MFFFYSLFSNQIFIIPATVYVQIFDIQTSIFKVQTYFLESFAQYILRFFRV